MIYEVKRLTVDELQQLYIMESNRLMEGVALKFSHNSLQSLRLNVFHLDQELRRRKSTYRLHRA